MISTSTIRDLVQTLEPPWARVVRRSTPPRLVRGFNKDKRGATAVEFGLVIVPLLGLLAAILDTGLAYFFERSLDAAAQGAARQVRIGTVQAAGVATSQAYVSNYVCPKTGFLLSAVIDCSKLIVDARTATSFTGNDLSNDFYKTQASNQFCLGAPSQVTVIRVTYPMPWYMPVIAVGPLGIAVNRAGLVNDVPSNPGAWTLLLTSVAVLRTEPYPQSQYTQQPGC